MRSGSSLSLKQIQTGHRPGSDLNASLQSSGAGTNKVHRSASTTNPQKTSRRYSHDTAHGGAGGGGIGGGGGGGKLVVDESIIQLRLYNYGSTNLIASL